jgi:hypothetical protein
LEGASHKLEISPYLKFLVYFGMSLKGVCQELDIKLHYKLSCEQKFLENRVPSYLGMGML